MKILIVDDMEENLYLLESLLKWSGYEVVSARNGIEALERLKEDSIDMIISDILMPKMDGFQLCRECKTDDTLKGIPFVFYTATYTEKKDEEFALSLGAAKFIVKPMEPERFVETAMGILKDQEQGLLLHPEVPAEKKEAIYLKEYSERLVRKLEHKMLELEKELTVRKQAEEALKASEKKYSTLVEKANDGIVILQDGFVKFANTLLLRLIGLSEDELVGKPFLDFVTPEYREIVLERYKKRLEGKEVPDNYEVEILSKDGKNIPVEVNGSLIKYEGRPADMAILRDITKRKQAQEVQRQLEAQKLVVEELKQLDRMKSEFVSIITHELRTPMTPLKSTIEMFLDGSLGEVTSEQRSFLDMMARNIERLAQFTTEVLSLSRLEAGRYSLNPATVSVRDALEPALELLESKAQTKKSTITLDVDAEVWAFADANALAQVVTNLVNNAIVHTGEGTAVTVSSKKIDEDSIEISVADNGQGISEDALPYIFDRFYQADRKNGPGYKGTGIGLALCKGLVDAMGGEISVESRVSEGTVFRFTLPTSPPEKKSKEATQ